MSLKPFHSTFVAAATVFSVAFAVWALCQVLQEGTAALAVVAVCAALFAVLPAVYAMWAMHKFGGPSC